MAGIVSEPGGLSKISQRYFPVAALSVAGLLTLGAGSTATTATVAGNQHPLLDVKRVAFDRLPFVMPVSAQGVAFMPSAETGFLERENIRHGVNQQKTAASTLLVLSYRYLWAVLPG